MILLYKVVNSVHHAVVVVIDNKTFRFGPWEEKILSEEIINHPDFKRCETLRIVGVHHEKSITNEEITNNTVEEKARDNTEDRSSNKSNKKFKKRKND